jgi:PAS domain S-box-containing protein
MEGRGENIDIVTAVAEREGSTVEGIDWMLVAHSTDILAMADESSNIIFASPSAEGVLGRSISNELIGHSIFEFVHPEDTEAVMDSFRKCLENPGITISPLFRFKRGDGSWIDLEATGKNLLNDPKVGAVLINLRDLSERKQAENDLRYRIGLEAMLADISTNFITTPGESIDLIVEKSMGTMGEFIGVDRVYLFQFGVEGELMSNTHEWCREGVEPQKESLQDVPCESYPWWMGQLEQGEAIHIPNVTKMPPEASSCRKRLEMQGVQSLLVVPVREGGKLWGFVGFDSFREKRRWGEDIPQVLNLVGEMLGAALSRLDREREKARWERLIKTMGRASSAFLGRADWEDIIQGVLEEAGRTTDVDRVVLVRTSETEGRGQRHIWVRDRADPVSRGTEFQDMDFLDDLMVDGPMRVTSCICDEETRRMMDSRGTRSMLAIPIIREKERWGAILLEDRCQQRSWSDLDIDALGILGDALGAAMLRRESEEAIRRERDLLQITLRSIVDGVIVVDNEWRIILSNSVAEGILGVRKEPVGRNLDELTRGENWSDMIGEVADGPFELETWDQRIIEGTVTPMLGSSGRLIGRTLILRDVTERRRMEENMERSARLESVGALAGGIAHEFNNELTVNLGQISIAKTMVEEGTRIHDHLEAAEKAALGANELINQLLVFSRGGTPVKERVDLPHLLREMTSLVLSGSNCTFRIETEEGLWPARVDRGLMAQVLSNVVLNAREAKPEGDEILVRARNRFIGGTEGIDIPPGKYIRIEVIDNGEGMTPDQIPKIFTPYYTTREEKAGLGLSISHSIVRKHDGTIDVDSSPGRGTCVSIYLPANGMTEEPTTVDQGEPHRGKGRVLVMDDEEAILDVAGEMLDRLGYRHMTARNGKEALERYHESLEEDDPFSVVIMDLTIKGGMGGKEAISRLLKMDPSARVIVSSGYSDNAIMGKHAEHGFAEVLPKPYDLRQLGTKLDRIQRGRS